MVRSRAFVTYLKPLFEKHFGVSGPEWSEENLYAHLTRVRRGPIRVDADELGDRARSHEEQENERDDGAGEPLGAGDPRGETPEERAHRKHHREDVGERKSGRPHGLRDAHRTRNRNDEGE